MVSSRLRILLSSFFLAAAAFQVSAQQPDTPKPDPWALPVSAQTITPPFSPGIANSSEITVSTGIPISTGNSAWRVEERLPALLTAPRFFAPEDTPIAAEATESWIHPWGWFAKGKTSGGLELGINGSDGNSEALSLKTGFELRQKTNWDELKFDLSYTKATADGVQTQHNALFNASYERAIGESTWDLFAKEAVEYDEFKAFNLRVAINAGVAYRVIQTDTTTWKTRFGAGASTEIGGPADEWVPEGVLGVDFERQLSSRQKISLTSDYFPDWSDFANYRVVTRASYEVLLSEEYNLNLKMSMHDRYDSTPNGAKPNDINYSLLLLWKM